MSRERRTPILIVGGGTGGVAAALAIARRGGTCIVTEPTDWIGGQLTSQAVPPDENRWVEGHQGIVGVTASYQAFRQSVRRWYRDHRPLTDEARLNPSLNPGNGWVSRLCCEPRVAHQVLHDLLAPHVGSGAVTILLHHEPVAAEVEGDRVRAVTFVEAQSNERVTISAEYFLDATETGDLYPLARVEYAVGAEGHSDHGEMHALPRADAQDFQAISWCFALEHRPGEDHAIDRPARYDFWRDYVPPLIDRPWPGELFSWTVAGHDEATPHRAFKFFPWPQVPPADELDMWRYRRINDASLYREDARVAFPDVTLVNWVQMDYFLRPIVDVATEQTRAALADARQQGLSLLYWLQNEAPRWDGSDGVGYPGLKLRGDELGTSDGFAKAPYIREGRRLKARTVVTEAHVGTDQRRRDKRPMQHVKPWGMAEPFADSVGIGHYRLDLHPSTGMRNSLYVQAAPFRIPMGALIPVRVRNVIAAGKGLGVTHITNGCYRLHPIEWNVGESAGALAHHCISQKRAPHAIQGNIARVREFQQTLVRDGIPVAWEWEGGAGLA
jgi:hypothetical protein